MTTNNTGTRDEWLAARVGLREAEKDLTRRTDEKGRNETGIRWKRHDEYDNG